VRIALVTPGGVDESETDRVIPAFLWLVERLARRHDVHVFALAQEPEPRDWSLLGAQVHNIGTVRGRRYRFHRTFARAHRTAPFDVLHALFGGSGVRAVTAGLRHRVPVVTHLTGDELVALRDLDYGAQRTLRGRLAIKVVTAMSRAVTVGTPYMGRLARDLGVAAQLVPLGVALDRWPVRAPRARDPSRPARLLNVSDVRPIKDHHMLLEAANVLRERGRPFELHLAGFDTTSGAMQRTDVAREAADVVRWRGVLSRDRLYALMCESDLLLHTSRHEAGPVAVLEAAVCGVPTVGTDVGHVNEWASDAAVAVPVGDPRALADAVIAVLDDEPHRLRLAHAAQARAVAIDADFTASRFERLYADLVSASGR
jgi:glycosyltransferase involved in cell wall biosynthesis